MKKTINNGLQHFALHLGVQRPWIPNKIWLFGGIVTLFLAYKGCNIYVSIIYFTSSGFNFAHIYKKDQTQVLPTCEVFSFELHITIITNIHME